MARSDARKSTPAVTGAVEGPGGLVVDERTPEEALAQQLVAKARQEGIELVGPGGLLTKVTKSVLETALNAELTEHLGYEQGDPAGIGTGNSRNGTTTKVVQTDVGPVELEVPRDRNSEFRPIIVPKYVRRLSGFDEGVVSLYAKGLTTGEIQSHLREIYGAEISRDTISRITDAVHADAVEWQNRPLDRLYPVVLIDAIFVKIRDGQVANRPIYVVMAVDLEGRRDVLGLWVGTGGEGAKQWLAILTEIKNRGVDDVLILCCDGLSGLPEAVAATWPRTDVQTCVVHLVRNTLRFSAMRHWPAITKELRAVYTAATIDEAERLFELFADHWGSDYPAIITHWRSAWGQFTPFLQFPPEVRRMIYTTNAIESLNARFRRSTRIRGHFPNEQAAIKILYLTICERAVKGAGTIGIVKNWKPVLNTLMLHYGDRFLN